MKRSSILFNLLGAVGLVGLLGGCGGGGGSSSPATGSASGSAASSGTITGFGSVFVNGKRFDTSGSSFTVDGQPGSQNDLRKGMTVMVTGSFSGDQRSASTVQQKDAVEGLVQSIAADRLSLVVMGQTVLVDNTTLIDNSNGLNGDINNLVAGDFVEVNGHIMPNGVIQATFIEKKLVGVTPEVRGFVSLHDATAKTFKIGNLTVDYSTSLIDDMPTPSGSNWNGLFVEIKGTNFNSVTTPLVATKVERENQGFGNNMDEFEVEGFVTQVVGVGDFFIGTTHVQTTPSTEFRGGTIDEIVVGAKLSAEGRLADGSLTAKHVKFHAAVKLEGNIATINGNTFTIDGLPGITVTVNSQTEGGSNLSGGNHVRVRGRLGSSNSVIATRVEQRSQDDDVDLQGPVQSVSGQVLTILEVAVDTSTISNDTFEGLNDQIIGRAAFFNVVKEGTLVKVKGRLANGVVTWREAELED
jgi:Domain of unknown function (DUF5666)